MKPLFLIAFSFWQLSLASSDAQEKVLEEWATAPFGFMEFSKDGSYLALAGCTRAFNRGGYDAVVWDVRTGKGWLSVPNVTSARFTPDKNILAVAQKDCVAFWDVAAKKELYRIPVDMSFWQMAFLKDGALLACAPVDGTVRVFDVTKKSEITRLRGHYGDSVRYYVSCLAVSPTGEYLATGGRDRRVILWSTADWKAVGEFEGHQGPVLAVAFFPDGKTLATAGQRGENEDRNVYLWSMETKRLRERIPCRTKVGPIEDMAVSPDGRTLVVAGKSPLLYLCDLASREDLLDMSRLDELIRRHKSVHYYRVAFSPDGKWVAAAYDGEEFGSRIKLIPVPSIKKAEK